MGKGRIDITGQRYGRLVAVRHTRTIAGRGTLWLFRCDCGSATEASSSNVRGGQVKSCGCLRVASNVARGHLPAGTVLDGNRRSPTYYSWINMRSRCAAKEGRMAVDYRLRGISCCERWSSYVDFLADMGERPPGTTLDRIDNDGGYSPDSCRWATPSQQRTNKRTPAKVREDRAAVAVRLGVGVQEVMDMVQDRRAS